jgi:chemotaxis signal transduction protein
MSEMDLAWRDAKAALFTLADMRCAILADRVVRIESAQRITRAPLLPPEVPGVVVLGGKVIPVLALRRLFDLAEQQEGELLLVTSGTENYALQVDRVLQVGILPDEHRDALRVDVDALLKRLAPGQLATGSSLPSADMAEGASVIPDTAIESRGLAVETATSRELLPLDAVVELSETLSVVPIPDPVFAGAVLHRRRLVPLISLDALLGRSASNGASFVVVELDGRRCALSVNAVIGLSAETENTVDLRSRLAELLPASQPTAPAPQQQTPSGITSTRYLLVELEGQTCAFALASVARIHTGCHVLKALAGRTVVGVTAVGGRVLPVVDLARIIGIDAPRAMQYFVELKPATETFMVAVGRIVGIASIGQDALVRQADSGAISAAAQLDGKLVWILAASLIAKHAESRRDAA